MAYSVCDSFHFWTLCERKDRSGFRVRDGTFDTELGSICGDSHNSAVHRQLPGRRSMATESLSRFHRHILGRNRLGNSINSRFGDFRRRVTIVLVETGGLQ
jgi:hypothetical protein